MLSKQEYAASQLMEVFPNILPRYDDNMSGKLLDFFDSHPPLNATVFTELTAVRELLNPDALVFEALRD